MTGTGRTEAPGSRVWSDNCERQRIARSGGPDNKAQVGPAVIHPVFRAPGWGDAGPGAARLSAGSLNMRSSWPVPPFLQDRLSFFVGIIRGMSVCVALRVDEVVSRYIGDDHLLDRPRLKKVDDADLPRELGRLAYKAGDFWMDLTHRFDSGFG